MAKLADAVAFLRTDDKELKSGLADADSEVTGWAGKLSGAIGGAAVGIAAAAGAVLVGATVAVGKAALDMGTEYQKGLNAIINGTGASGDALDAMGQSVRNLKSSAAGLGVDMEKIGATLAEVNTRTGATGSELEDLTGQILQFSRLTGTDSVQNVQLLTRTMGDWGVSMEDSGQLLDTIYGAGQAFGISVDSLAGKLVQFGAPLRQMGFSLEESTAMLGKWEKEGVNTELVIGSLRIAAGKFARENVPLQDGLRQTMEAIKGAASEAEGLAIAMDVFGARAGPDMAAAIREGRFELDGAIAALQGTQGGLADAAERTLTFQDRWGIAMAQIGDALIPLGQKLMDLADRVMPFLTAAIVVVIDAVVPLVDWIVQAIDAVIGLIGSNEQLTDSFGQVGGVIQSTFGPIVERAQEIFGALGEKVSAVVGQNLNFFRAWIDQNMPRIQQIVSTVLGAITAFWEKHGAAIVAAVQRYFGWIMEFWSLVFRTLLNVVQVFLQVLTGDWEGAGQTLQSIVRDLWTTLTGIFGDMLNAIRDLWLGVDWGGIGQSIIDGIVSGLQGAKGWLMDKAREIAQGVMAPFDWVWNFGSPSRTAAEKIGRPIMEGVGVGMEQALAGVNRSMAGALSGMVSGMSTPAGAAAGAPVNVTININGAADASGVGLAARDGVLAALRAAGV